MKFNINSFVRVKLNEHGHLIHRQRHSRLLPSFEYHPVEQDEEGWSKWQLWKLMHVFGDHVMLGSKVPFETEIELITPESKELPADPEQKEK